MDDPAAEFWLVFHLAARCLENGSVQTFWPELERYAGRPGILLRGVATIVWLGLLPTVPLVAARRRRLVGRALEAVVRAIATGEQVSVAVDRGVRWLVQKGLTPDRARHDLERLLAGFLAGTRAGSVAERNRPAAGDDRSSAGG